MLHLQANCFSNSFSPKVLQCSSFCSHLPLCLQLHLAELAVSSPLQHRHSKHSNFPSNIVLHFLTCCNILHQHQNSTLIFCNQNSSSSCLYRYSCREYVSFLATYYNARATTSSLLARYNVGSICLKFINLKVKPNGQHTKLNISENYS